MPVVPDQHEVVAQGAEFRGHNTGITVQGGNEIPALLIREVFGYMHDDFDSMSRFVSFGVAGLFHGASPAYACCLLIHGGISAERFVFTTGKVVFSALLRELNKAGIWLILWFLLIQHIHKL